MEAEVFFLMELQGGDYNSLMELPWSRRKRFVEEKQQLEHRRAEQQKADANRRRATRRRR